MPYVKLMRIYQWYKNLVVFLPLIFAGQLFNKSALILTIIAFFVLCFISSAGYIINDIADKTRDLIHPEKRKRPIASGKIKLSTAILIKSVLLITALVIAKNIDKTFLYIIVTIFLIMQVYTFLLKNEAFADIITISTLFVLRAVAGAVAIKVRISPWLILCTFFLSLLIITAKRRADLRLLGQNAANHKEVFKYYSLKILNAILLISIVSLVMAYSLYSFLSIYALLILTLPFALYVMLRYLYLIYEKESIARNPEKIIYDKKLIIGIFIWFIIVIFIIY
jgi:4-hydroxybenzoate polyprenyltransferase